MAIRGDQASSSGEPVSLARLVRVLRENALLTQEELAQRAGVSVGTVRGLESGRVSRPRSGTVRLLAHAMGLRDRERMVLAAVARGEVRQAEEIPNYDHPAITAVADTLSPPAQLPPAVADFTGRQEEVARLRDVLGGAAGPAVTIAVVGGGGGIGKTALAVQVGHLLREHYPDGQLYARVRPVAGDDASAADVLAGFLRALGVPAQAIPDAPDERASLYRSRLARRRMLVVLDDVDSTAQVRSLLPGMATCGVLITSRSRLADLEGAHHVDLDVLTADESTSLLGRIAGQDRLDSESRDAARLVRSCGGLPLAVRIAGARLVARPGWSVRALAQRLADQQRRLDELTAGDLAVRTSFEVGYRALSAEPARALRLMATLDWVTMPAAAVAVLVDVPVEAAERILEQLIDGYLLEAPGPAHFQIHELLRLFAREHAVGADTAAERTEALTRVLRWYLANLRNAHHQLSPGWRTNDDETGGYAGDDFTDRNEAVLWLERERTNLTALLRQACSDAQVPAVLAGRVLECMKSYEWLGYLKDCHDAADAVLEAALRDRDTRAEATARLVLGSHAGVLRIDFTRAIEELQRSVALSEAAGDVPVWMRACNMLGCVHVDRHQRDDAAEAFGKLLEHSRRHGDLGGECAALCNLGMVHTLQGEPARAIACLEPALDLARRVGDVQMHAAVLGDLGAAYHRGHRYDDAERCHAESLALYRQLDLPQGQALALLSRAEASLDRGQVQAALEHCTRALQLSRDIGQRYLEARSLLLLGRTHHELGDADEARACWRASLAGFEAVRAPEVDHIRALLELTPPA